MDQIPRYFEFKKFELANKIIDELHLTGKIEELILLNPDDYQRAKDFFKKISHLISSNISSTGTVMLDDELRDFFDRCDEARLSLKQTQPPQNGQSTTKEQK